MTERRKRKTAILTDTPEKNKIEDDNRRREQKKNKGRSPKGTEQRKPKKRPKQQKGNQRLRKRKLQNLIPQQMKNGIVLYVWSHILIVNHEKNGSNV